PLLLVVERVEYLVHTLCTETDAGIAYGQDHVVVAALGSDEQIARTVLDISHRVGRVEEKIEYYLLELHAIAGDRRNGVVQFRAQYDTATLQLASRQRNYLASCFVEVDRFRCRLLLGK